MQLDHLAGGSFMQKGIKLKTFPQRYVISLRGVVIKCSRVEPKVPDSSPTQFFFSSFLFPRLFALLFSINIHLNNSYLIKCNKQQEKYRVSRETIVHHILNIWINNLNFYHFLQFTVGKPKFITSCHDHFLNNAPTSSFYRLMVIITFQDVNRTFNVIFDSFKSHGPTKASINRMCRSITIF